MDVTQATALLVLASTYDNRKVTREQASAWHEALGGVRFDDARQAVVDHYRNDRRWLMPADVMGGVRKIVAARQQALMGVDLPPELQAMDDGPEFNAAYLAWVKSGELPTRQLTA